MARDSPLDAPLVPFDEPDWAAATTTASVSAPPSNSGRRAHPPPSLPLASSRGTLDDDASDAADGGLLSPGGGGAAATMRSALARAFGGGGGGGGGGGHHAARRARRPRGPLAAAESVAYAPPDSAVYRRWLAGQPHGRTWDRWLMMAIVGAAVGLLAAALKAVTAVFSRARVAGVARLAAAAGPLPAWLFGAALAAGLAALAAAPVAYIAPAAAGAGVAEVMAALNGVVVPRAFNVVTLVVKFASTAAAVASGLPVGPEGPMVHMGAAVGGGLSQGASTTLGVAVLPSLTARFRNPADRRDFVAAGTAAGIAAAFGAPIGGLLFAFEELSVPFSQALAAQIFLAAGVAVLSLDTARSAWNAVVGGRFGLFDGDAVVWEVRTTLAAHVAAIPVAAAVGAGCGALAALFTAAVVGAGRARASVAARSPRRARVAEAAALAALVATVAVLGAAAFPCTPVPCVRGDEPGAPPVCPGGDDGRGPPRVVAPHVAVFTCGPPVPPPGPAGWPPAPANASAPPVAYAYNQAATLTLTTGEDAVRRLLSRGTHRELGYGALTLTLLLYLTGAALAAGASLSCGLFVPMLVVGACVGRVAGLAAVDAAAAAGAGSAGAPPGVFLPPSPWAWLDPGAFALLGAAAFMGGVTRLTASVAVIMVEVSNDVRLLLPLLAAILAAKAVADAVGGASLYHRLLADKGVPWLPPAPRDAGALDAVRVAAAAAAPVAVARERMTVASLRALLRDTPHAAWPVVRPTAGGEVFVGVLPRGAALALLKRAAALARGGADPAAVARLPPLSHDELSRTYVSAAARGLLAEQQLAVLQGGGGGGNGGGGNAHPDADAAAPASTPTLDLAPYLDASAPSVRADASLARAYALFVSLGLRHLTVVDAAGRVRGVLTRKDLVPAALAAAAAKGGGGRAGEDEEEGF